MFKYIYVYINTNIIFSINLKKYIYIKKKPGCKLFYYNPYLFLNFKYLQKYIEREIYEYKFNNWLLF